MQRNAIFPVMSVKLMFDCIKRQLFHKRSTLLILVMISTYLSDLRQCKIYTGNKCLKLENCPARGELKSKANCMTISGFQNTTVSDMCIPILFVRAYRIGQGRDVRVFRLVCSGTIEENIYLRQVYKQVNSISVSLYFFFIR